MLSRIHHPIKRDVLEMSVAVLVGPYPQIVHGPEPASPSETGQMSTNMECSLPCARLRARRRQRSELQGFLQTSWPTPVSPVSARSPFRFLNEKSFRTDRTNPQRSAPTPPQQELR
jgi:hypothetical protein